MVAGKYTNHVVFAMRVARLANISDRLAVYCKTPYHRNDKQVYGLYT